MHLYSLWVSIIFRVSISFNVEILCIFRNYCLSTFSVASNFKTVFSVSSPECFGLNFSPNSKFTNEQWETNYLCFSQYKVFKSMLNIKYHSKHRGLHKLSNCKNGLCLQGLDSQNSYILWNTKSLKCMLCWLDRHIIVEFCESSRFIILFTFDNEITICKGVMVDDIISLSMLSVFTIFGDKQRLRALYNPTASSKCKLTSTRCF